MNRASVFVMLDWMESSNRPESDLPGQTQPSNSKVFTYLLFGLLGVFLLLGLLCGAGNFAMELLHRRMVEQREANDLKYLESQIQDLRDGRTDSLLFYCHDNTDRLLATLPVIDKLTLVYFKQTEFTAAGLACLRLQPNLTGIVFDTVTIDQDKLQVVAEMPHLTWIKLRNINLSDYKVRIIAAIPSLRRLEIEPSVEEFPVTTDAALDSLAKCSQLEELTLPGDWFSDEAVERLRMALPGCEIIVKDRTQRAQPEPAPSGMPAAVGDTP